MKILLEDWAFMPTRAHETDAGLDLYAMEDEWIPAKDSRIFWTGVHIELPHGYYGKIESRSGLNVKKSIVSCGGVIDEGYTGQIAVKLYNFDSDDHLIKRGDKIAQLVIQPYIAPELELVDTLKPTERGENGFGSTGR